MSQIHYQVLYSKRSWPLVYWIYDREDASSRATRLRSVGYDVTIWAHTKGGARKTDL